MIRRQGEYETEIRENMRDGRGQVRIEHLWQSDELRNRARLCARLTLDPGASIGFHQHLNESEIFIILSGQARMMDEDEEQLLHPGDSILTSEAGHSVEAVGDQPLEMVAVILT